MTITYRHILMVMALFMGALAVLTVFLGYFEHSPVMVAFQFLASALLIVLALA